MTDNLIKVLKVIGVLILVAGLAAVAWFAYLLISGDSSFLTDLF